MTTRFFQSITFQPNSSIRFLMAFGMLFFFSIACQAQKDVQWLQFEGKEGPGKGKHIVLISGDDEYRSEESMPMLGKLLAEHYGFKCTVLFPIDPETGDVVPSYQNNIPGLEHLATADLMILLTRFRELDDQQTQYFEDYLKSGKPIIGMRTSTHAFHYSKNKTSPFAKYGFDSKEKDWTGGFGQKILGETWVAHHGDHGKEGTRALIDGPAQLADHPILRGVKDIWVASDVYTVKNLIPEAKVLVYGQPTKGMTADAALIWEKSVMPIAWTKEYQIEGGQKGKVFTTTMGASVDLESADLRKLIVNAAFWSLDMPDKITEDMNVSIVGNYQPTPFGFGTFRKGMRVSDFK
ncbi:ThuA domain-containing protein [Rhodonellum sp.]|uniref:ThuA domain-containing protein n=1 Tax=Rhodonellum sp. TaxID=2231180 RepID=UPI002728E815|nr:ThuA domain-containing protein [Rhodonellum sp.]MDO9551780.1 ThuA domain-containing protein [Rhodonellum sp.]